jgi:hypothetical protein
LNIINCKQIRIEKRNNIHIIELFLCTQSFDDDTRIVNMYPSYIYIYKAAPNEKYILDPDESLLARHTRAYNAGVTDRTKILQETPFRHHERVLYLEIRDFFHVVHMGCL